MTTALHMLRLPDTQWWKLVINTYAAAADEELLQHIAQDTVSQKQPQASQ